MNAGLRITLALAAAVLATQAAAQATFYENDGFAGRTFTTQRPVGDFSRYGFNDRASSAVVIGRPWEACEDAEFGGRCIVLRPGRYPSLRAMGLNDRISSARIVGPRERIDESRYGPPPQFPPADYRRRRDERLYEADVISVHAVLGPPEQRCWIERDQWVQDQGGANVPGAIAGALIGGILGHQLGGGGGKDVTTIGGAVLGAAVGSRVGRGDGAGQDIQRCTNVSGHARPEYWDVTYRFRGIEHRVQLTAPPGPTITVNRRGEPRE